MALRTFVDQKRIRQEAATAYRPQLPSPGLLPSQPRLGQVGIGFLLAMAEHLRVAQGPQRSGDHHGLMAKRTLVVDEFLMQWPCEVELPVDLDDRTFIEGGVSGDSCSGNRASWKRADISGLCKSDAVSKLDHRKPSGLRKFRSLERRMRVAIWGRVITEAGRPEAETAPAVRWRQPNT